MRRHLRLAVLLAASALPFQAAAQNFSMMANWAQSQMLQDNLQRNLRNAGQARAGAPAGTARPMVRQMVRRSAMAATAYRASPMVAARVRAQFVAFIRKTSGDAAARALAAELERRDYLALWAAHAAQDGLRLGDVADAFAEYWVENWQMANGVNYAPPAEVRAVRDQVAATMGANPGFARLTDAQKQEIAEIFIYNQIVQDANYVSAMKRGDHATQQRLGDAAVARFQKEMRVDLRQLTLTRSGFVARRS